MLATGSFQSRLSLDFCFLCFVEMAFKPPPLTCAMLLQANLPLLQRELLHCARLAKQNPAQYLAQHEQLLLDASTTSPVDSSELLLDVNENGKRRTPDRWAPPVPPPPRSDMSREWNVPSSAGKGGVCGWVPGGTGVVFPGCRSCPHYNCATAKLPLCTCVCTFI